MNTYGVGIANSSPWITLNLGDCSAAPDPFINFGKNNAGDGNRNCRLGMGYNSGFTFCIGDLAMSIIILIIGHNNSVCILPSRWAPQASLGIDPTGRVIMPNGYGTAHFLKRSRNIRNELLNKTDKRFFNWFSYWIWETNDNKKI